MTTARRLAAFVAVLLLAVFAMPAAAPAATAGRFVAAYYIGPNGEPLCITAPAGYANGSNVYTEPCRANEPRQGWVVEWLGGKIVLRSAGNYSKCMDTLNRITTTVGIWDCIDTVSTQRWNVAQLGNGLSMWGNVVNGTNCLAYNIETDSNDVDQDDCDPYSYHQIWKG